MANVFKYLAHRFCFLVLVTSILSACIAPSSDETAKPIPSILPIPMQIDMHSGALVIDNSAKIMAIQQAEQRVGVYLADLMQKSSGKHFTLSHEGGEGVIRFILSAEEEIEAEGYNLHVDADGVVITAASEAGLFYGAVTLWQLLTPWPEGQDSFELPYMHIYDAPAYAWRGVLLDSARHMQSKDYIKTFIDWMALHKLNTLHWHLTDDQGWRIEIKAFPELTNKGAWRVPAGDAYQSDIDPQTGQPRLYGGYYTQDDIREIVAHAQSRHINIVPEIDVPGHALAAIVAYPELGVVKAPDAVMSDWGVYPYLFNPKDSTFDFLDEVLAEVTALFPSQYIHVGGDEAPKHQWRDSEEVQAFMRARGIEDEDKLQGYFTARLEEILQKYDRYLVGWDEIVEGGLGDDAIVMSWRGLEGAIIAAERGHQSIIAPNSHLYLDYRQSDLADEPPGRGRQITLKDIYQFDYLVEVPEPDKLKASVKGLQANLWTEHMPTEANVTHMAFPRLMALAELAWHAPKNRDFNLFAKHMAKMLLRYQSVGLEYADSAIQPVLDVRWDKSEEAATLMATIQLSQQVNIGDIRYTLDGSVVTARSPLYLEPLILSPGTHVNAASFLGGSQLSDTQHWQLHPEDVWYFEDTDLHTCTSWLGLHLIDDAPVRGKRPNFKVDIINPCWILKDVDMSNISAIELVVGQVPYNFQLMDDIDNVIVYPAPENGPAFEIRAQGCEGSVIGQLPFPHDKANHELSVLVGDLQTDGLTNTDLCFLPKSGVIDPLWVIESGRLISAPESK